MSIYGEFDGDHLAEIADDFAALMAERATLRQQVADANHRADMAGVASEIVMRECRLQVAEGAAERDALAAQVAGLQAALQGAIHLAGNAGACIDDHPWWQQAEVLMSADPGEAVRRVEDERDDPLAITTLALSNVEFENARLRQMVEQATAREVALRQTIERVVKDLRNPTNVFDDEGRPYVSDGSDPGADERENELLDWCAERAAGFVEGGLEDILAAPSPAAKRLTERLAALETQWGALKDEYDTIDRMNAASVANDKAAYGDAVLDNTAARSNHLAAVQRLRAMDEAAR